MRAAAIVVAFLVSCGVHAQTMGKLEGPLRVLVSGSPGGPADSGIRLLVPALTADMPRIVVDNRPGAGGQAAGKLLMNSAPDGRTLMVGSSGSHVIAPLMSKNPPYDPVSDFTPIILITSNGLVLVANQKYSPNNFSELLAVAQKNRSGVNVGAAGATGELAIALLENMASIKMNRIRWNGAGPTEVGVLSGEVEMALLPPVSSLGHIREGRLKGIGVTSSRRIELLPNLPTFQEQGVKGYEFQLWNGLFAPPKFPHGLVKEFNKAFANALQSPDTRKRYESLGFSVMASSPSEFVRVIKNDVEKNKNVITAIGLHSN